MNIDSIENGYVIDHIPAGKGMQIYNVLSLDKLNCQVAIITNAKSQKNDVKDIIKINELVELDLDTLDSFGAVAFGVAGVAYWKYIVACPYFVEPSYSFP